MVRQILAVVPATFSIVVLLDAPKKEYISCIGNGAIGWITFLILEKLGFSATVSSLGATLILTIVSRVLSVLRKSPVTIFLVTGIFPLVPGAGIYYTAYYLLMNQLPQAIEKGVGAFKVAGAISLGIVFGFFVPQQLFHRLAKLSDSKHRP